MMNNYCTVCVDIMFLSLKVKEAIYIAPEAEGAESFIKTVQLGVNTHVT